MVVPLQTTAGLDWVHQLQVQAWVENQKGGLEIGGERYSVSLKVLDNNMELATETAAINELVHQDKAHCIFYMGPFIMSWLNTTEAAKMIVMDHSARRAL